MRNPTDNQVVRVSSGEARGLLEDQSVVRTVSYDLSAHGNDPLAAVEFFDRGIMLCPTGVVELILVVILCTLYSVQFIDDHLPQIPFCSLMIVVPVKPFPAQTHPRLPFRVVR